MYNNYMKELVYLPNRENIKLYQDTDMFCINSDTFALGEFLEVYRNDTVMDFGTNTGALLLYASRFNPKKLIGVDINEEALKLAKENMELNGITNYELINEDINTFKHEEVDVIICNPPYFNDSDKSSNKYLALAKNEESLKLESLIKAIRRNLKCHGTLYFLYATPRLEKVILELNKNHLTIKEMKFVYDVNKKYSNVFMVKAVKGYKKGLNVVKPLIIDRKKGN